MVKRSRRQFLKAMAKTAGAAAAGGLTPGVIQRALAVPANRRTGSIRDIEHVVILTQENRSFDHYFGCLNGVRGFADPFPIPVPERPGIRSATVWVQPDMGGRAASPVVMPFRLDTAQNFGLIRAAGTPHGWKDAQQAWSQGLLHAWPTAKQNHSMGYFSGEDIPFQWALANAFTLCDAYHCSMHAGTNPNRLFIWTGTNDPEAQANGPALYNDYEWFDADPGRHGGYAWVTYAERLEAAGITWQVYQAMNDNFTDNPLAGFQRFRAAWLQRPGASPELQARGVSTRDLDLLAADVLANRLPQVSWIVATAEGSEHPGPSSPAQGAAYTERVLEALTANPEVWSKTVLLINFDENDGFFDHVPPPAVPSYTNWDPDPTKASLAGASTVSTVGEYHEHLLSYHPGPAEEALLHRPYGLGPRVPLYVVSPWSKGGWVNSEVFDHTSVIRFLEARFGVPEPNISGWRRAVCGDLCSAFDFGHLQASPPQLPPTPQRAAKARALPDHQLPVPPLHPLPPTQARGSRPSRPLPYALQATSSGTDRGFIEIVFTNTGTAAAVFHVYDRLHLDRVPRRYTVGSGRSLQGSWDLSDSAGAYDLWVLGPNGFHRHFCGLAVVVVDPLRIPVPDIQVRYLPGLLALGLTLGNNGALPVQFRLRAMRYREDAPVDYQLAPFSTLDLTLGVMQEPWYDYVVTAAAQPSFGRRFAGRIETGAASISDPEMGGAALVSAFSFQDLR